MGTPGALDAAIWWPESVYRSSPGESEQHNRVNLYLINPDDVVPNMDSGCDSTSVFQRVSATGPAGDWTLQLDAPSMAQGATQDVYWAAFLHRAGGAAATQPSNAREVTSVNQPTSSRGAGNRRNGDHIDCLGGDQSRGPHAPAQLQQRLRERVLAKWRRRRRRPGRGRDAGGNPGAGSTHQGGPAPATATPAANGDLPDGVPDWLKALTQDNPAVDDAVLLAGYPAASPRQGYYRLYMDPELKRYLDVSRTGWLGVSPVENGLLLNGAQFVWVRREDGIHRWNRCPDPELSSKVPAGAGQPGTVAEVQPTRDGWRCGPATGYRDHAGEQLLRLYGGL